MSKEKKEVTDKGKGSIEDIKSMFAKEFGKTSLMSSTTVQDAQFVIPSSSIGLNMLLGCGGAPSGRIIELFGPEGGGKTRISLDFAVNCQKMGKSVCFIDVEQALDIFWAKKIGIDEDKFVWLRPDNGDIAFNMLDKAICSSQFGLVILDSVAALSSEEEMAGNIEDVKNRVGGFVAKMMSVGLRKITTVAAKTATSIIFINQVRDNIGVTYGPKEVTPGGRALKFYSSIRLRVNKVGKFVGKLAYYESKADATKSEDIIIGQEVNVSVEKNKMAAPVFQKAEFYMHYNSGVDRDKELLSIATGIGIMEKKRGEEIFTYKGQDIDLTAGKKIEPTLFSTIEKDIVETARLKREGSPVAPVTSTNIEELPPVNEDDADHFTGTRFEEGKVTSDATTTLPLKRKAGRPSKKVSL